MERDVTTSVAIDRCPEAEVPRLFGLAKSVFADAPGWDDGRVLEALSRDLLFLARDEGEPAGYVALRHEPDGSFVIEQLFVLPGHERRGVGRRLLDYAEGYAIAERAPALRIVVERDNTPARAFYRRAGFVPVEGELFERSLPSG
jgi:ribosomal protein S18 acetylase RimI-like enzyme